MAVHGQTRMLNGGFNVFWFSSFYTSFFFKTKHSTVNCQPLQSFSPSSRLETDCITSKLTRMMSRVRALSGYGRRICASRLTAGQNTAQVRLAIRFSFCFPQRRANHRALESDALP